MHRGPSVPVLRDYVHILVPHAERTPCVASLPLSMVVLLASFISRLARHFT